MNRKAAGSSGLAGAGLEAGARAKARAPVGAGAAGTAARAEAGLAAPAADLGGPRGRARASGPA